MVDITAGVINMVKLFPGSSIHIWTEGSATLMRIYRAASTDLECDLVELGPSDSIYFLSDHSKPEMGCNLRFEVVG